MQPSQIRIVIRLYTVHDREKMRGARPERLMRMVLRAAGGLFAGGLLRPMDGGRCMRLRLFWDCSFSAPAAPLSLGLNTTLGLRMRIGRISVLVIATAKQRKGAIEHEMGANQLFAF